MKTKTRKLTKKELRILEAQTKAAQKTLTRVYGHEGV